MMEQARPSWAERCPGGARRTVAERPHGVEEVGDAGHAVCRRRLHRLGVGLAVAGGDDDAAGRERGDVRGRHALRRERHQGAAGPKRGQQVEIARARRPQGPAVMGAAPRRVEVRPLEVDAEHPRLVRLQRRAHRRDRPHHVRTHTGDEGREKTRGPARPVGAADRRDGRRRRRVVEHHAAAAIDLEVDEAGGERAAREPHDAGRGGDRVVGHDVADRAALVQQGTAGRESVGRVQPGAGERVHRRASGPAAGRRVRRPTLRC